jgi:Integrase core domain
LFVVPGIGVNLLYALIIVRLDRRNLIWVNATTNPAADWIARQLTEAFPWNEAPQYVIRDRDCIYGTAVTRRLRAMGIRDKPIAPASPWQNGFAERLIGSIRRECLDHFVVWGETHLRRILRTYACYYNDIRTHWSLDKDAPPFRPIQRTGIINSHAILNRAAIRVRETFSRSTIAPFSSKPITCSAFLPVSIPMVCAIAVFALLGMACPPRALKAPGSDSR